MLNAILPDRLLVWIRTMKTRSLQFASGRSGTSQRTTPRSIMFGNSRPGPLCTCSVDNRPPTSRCLAESRYWESMVTGKLDTTQSIISNDHPKLNRFKEALISKCSQTGNFFKNRTNQRKQISRNIDNKGKPILDFQNYFSIYRQ